MNEAINQIDNFVNSFWAWYIVLVAFGILILYKVSIKKDWQKLRIERRICYKDNTSFKFRMFWMFKHKLVIYIFIFIFVFVINIFLIDENNFKSALTVTQRIKNILPVLVVYISIALAQKISIKNDSDGYLDKTILLFIKLKKEMISNLVNKEIDYIKKKIRKIINQISQKYFSRGIFRKKVDSETNRKMLKKLLFILLEFCACDEVEIKHNCEITAFQSDSKKQDFLERVISIRASLIDIEEKPFLNDNEFTYLCTGILPEIGICYSDIYATLKRINKYRMELIETKVKERDLYFQKKFISNNEAKEVISNDIFDNEIAKVFQDKERNICTTVDNR